MIRWEKDVADHDYDAAVNYLSLRVGPGKAARMAQDLKQAELTTRRANDILRSVGRDPLPFDDPGVEHALKKVFSGKALSPILVADNDIADGYHRVSLAYRLDPFSNVPLKFL